jgi:hypothetical protein
LHGDVESTQASPPARGFGAAAFFCTFASKKTAHENDTSPDAAYSQIATLERLAQKGSIEAIKMLQELQREKALDEIVKEKIGLLKPQP